MFSLRPVGGPATQSFPGVLPPRWGNNSWCRWAASSGLFSGSKHQTRTSFSADRCTDIFIVRGAAVRHDRFVRKSANSLRRGPSHVLLSVDQTPFRRSGADALVRAVRVSHPNSERRRAKVCGPRRVSQRARVPLISSVFRFSARASSHRSAKPSSRVRFPPSPQTRANREILTPQGRGPADLCPTVGSSCRATFAVRA